MTLKPSFEFFAPKTVDAAFGLAKAANELAQFQPEFMSVTCGTGSGTADLTDETVAALQHQTNAPVLAHMTCGATSRNGLDVRAKSYRRQGMPAVVALRGDAPDTKTSDLIHYPNVAGFVAGLAAQRLGAYVAAYPEIHPMAASPEADLNALKAKQDAGAIGAITQFFFDADTFLAFRDRCAKAGITLPLIPGILPVTNWRGVEKMAAQCGTNIAPDLAEGFARAAREGRAELMATAHATEICDRLHREGCDRLHFYTMNRSTVTASICAALDIRHHAPLRNVA